MRDVGRKVRSKVDLGGIEIGSVFTVLAPHGERAMALDGNGGAGWYTPDHPGSAFEWVSSIGERGVL